MKITAIIQARMGASRLPGKVLMDMVGKTVLERVIERVKLSKMVNEVVVATTVNEKDRKIIALCGKIGVPCFPGSEDDVLDRFYQAAKSYGPDHIVRITSDCPLMDSHIIDDVVRLHLAEKSDYTSNTLEETYPDGEDVEIFTFNALEKAWREAKLQSEREHVTPYIWKNSSVFKLSVKKNEINLSGKRWTLDEERDYAFIKRIYEELYPGNPNFGIKEIAEYIKNNKNVESINSEIKRNEGYEKSIRNDKVIK
ncbi:MAG: glycosyltransferase family protein [Endomicrobiales bacterium]|nr:glycosyltransferase family protein [Endomicrobiales bacterium]